MDEHRLGQVQLRRDAVFRDVAGRAGAQEVDQATIDQAFGAGRSGDVPPVLPKGLSAETAELVLAAMRAVDEISASEAADRVGLSRVTARRYLEHFVDTGAAEVRLQYGGTGRPERRYRASR